MTEAQINVEKEQTEQEVSIEREPFTTGGQGHDYTAGEGLKLNNYEFSADTDVLATKSDLSGKQDTLTAGENISIENNTISATDTTYTAGDNITISDDNVISATGSAQVQSDWSENDSTDPAFVQNRPCYEHIIENSIEQTNTTDAGSTPDSNYVWFIEQVMDYSLASVLSGFADGGKFKVSITYSVNGTESTDSGNFILSFDGDAASLDYDAPTGNRWYGAYLTEINDATTIRFPVPASDVGSTVYITKIEYEYVKKLDAEYLPIDGETITVNADGELESAGGGGPTVVQTIGTSTTDVMSQNAVRDMIYQPNTSVVPLRAIQIGSGASYSGTVTNGSPIVMGHNARINLVLGNASSGVAIGSNSSVSNANKYGVAIGYGSTATRQELSVGGGEYLPKIDGIRGRYVSNVLDPQEDQDAATKKYVDELISALDNRIKALEGN